MRSPFFFELDTWIYIYIYIYITGMEYQFNTIESQYRYNGETVILNIVARADKKPMTLDEVHDILQDLATLDGDNNRRYVVNLEYNALGWKSMVQYTTRDANEGKISELLEPLTYDNADLNGDGDEVINKISFIALPAPVLQGGCRDASRNDCLFLALRSAFGGRIPCAKHHAYTDAQFREAIGQHGHGKIPATNAIFDRMNALVGSTVKINCTGEFLYNSSKSCHRTINIRLFNQHYSLVAQDGRSSTHAIANKNACGDERLRIPRFNRDGTVTLIDIHNNETVVSYSDYCKFKLSPFDSPYIILRKFKLFEEYFKIKKEMDQLCQNFNCYGSLKKYCLELFRVNSQTVPKAPALTPLEETWIGKRNSKKFCALRGGIIYHRDGSFEDCYAYDVISMYPSIMDSFCFVPNGLPQECILTEFPEFLKLGLYRMKVTVPHNMRALWQGGSGFCIYTQVDYQMAQMLGASFEWPCDDQPNALIYDKADQVRFHDLFHPFVNKLFQAKQSGNTVAKSVLNMLWGALNERNSKHLLINRSSKPIDLDGEIIGSRVYDDSGRAHLKVHENNKPLFVGEYPRAGVWLTAQARLKLVKLLLPHVDKIRRIHTDGFILQGVGNLKTGNELGDLKLEKQGACTIKGMLKPTFSN
jgi:hypothetical protein